MELLIKAFVLGSFLVISGCNATKEVADEPKKMEQSSKQSTVDYSSEGFSKVMVVRSAANECPFVIVLEETKEQLDPVNFDEGKFSEFKKDDMAVWVKFRRLRRASRCPGVNPVELLEIKE